MTHPTIVTAWRSRDTVRAIVNDQGETELVLYPDHAPEMNLNELRGLTVEQARALRFTQGVARLTSASMAGEDRHTTTLDGAAAHAATMHRNPLTGLYW